MKFLVFFLIKKNKNCLKQLILLAQSELWAYSSFGAGWDFRTQRLAFELGLSAWGACIHSIWLEFCENLGPALKLQEMCSANQLLA